VIKLLKGTQGMGVVLAETRKAAQSVLEAFRNLDAYILVQEYIKEAAGADIRCFIIGGKVIATMKRQAGEPHRFNPEAINLGVKGILRVMNELGMWRIRRRYRPRQSMEARHRSWGRARRGGILRLQVKLGRWVSKHQTIAVIHDAFGEEKITQLAPCDGLVIGHTNNPLVNQGDAVIHLARDVTTHGP
jgi:predicted deacylase